MNIKFIIIFSLLSLVNVVFATFKSLVTIKGGKWAAALANAGYFAFYNIMLIFTVADFPMWVTKKRVCTFTKNSVTVNAPDFYNIINMTRIAGIDSMMFYTSFRHDGFQFFPNLNSLTGPGSGIDDDIMHGAPLICMW